MPLPPCLISGIDAVAPVLTNFFLVTYTLTNLSAALLELSGCPNFRPHWRFYSWHLSLAGAAVRPLPTASRGTARARRGPRLPRALPDGPA